MKRPYHFAVCVVSLLFIPQIGSDALSDSRNLPIKQTEDDGTYKTINVTSFEACEALCADEVGTCRGAVAEQPDISKPEMVCRLNNGFGTNPVFPSVPPEDLDLAVAVNDLNTYRTRFGLSPVTLNARLNAASRVHAEDLAQAGIISHTGTDGSGHGDRLQRQGYYFTIAGENVATGQKSWPDVFKAWQDSPGHNENLLRDDVSEFGIALVYDPKSHYQTYWAMIVANPLPEAEMKLLRSDELHRYSMHEK